MLTGAALCVIGLPTNIKILFNLYAKGMFYRAYEQSAFFLCSLFQPSSKEGRWSSACGIAGKSRRNNITNLALTVQAREPKNNFVLADYSETGRTK